MDVNYELNKRGIPFEKEEFNSNNDWRFGGAVGVRIKFSVRGDDYVITQATAYYRHLDPKRFVKMVKNQRTEFDLNVNAGDKKLKTFFNSLGI